MRTTLELDDELIAAAKEIARERSTTLGQVISQLARETLARNAPPRMRNGVPLFTQSASSVKPDLDLVNKLRDES